jgi:hypothetical protein
VKALDDFRFQGDFVAAVDTIGYLSVAHHHCSQCLTQKHASGTVSYLHPVLEAKPLTAPSRSCRVEQPLAVPTISAAGAPAGSHPTPFWAVISRR